jgi:predicted RNA-binding protein with PIN domain
MRPNLEPDRARCAGCRFSTESPPILHAVPDARLIVDGMNLIGSRPDRWWKDRPGAMRTLVAELDRYAEATGDEILVVFDGRPLDPEPAARMVQVGYARRRGPDAADDEIVRIVERDGGEGLRVVTSDKRLADRVRRRGAEVGSSGAFRRRLDEASGDGEAG